MTSTNKPKPSEPPAKGPAPVPPRDLPNPVIKEDRGGIPRSERERRERAARRR